MVKLKKTLRWFGANDAVQLGWLRELGIEGVVTALHHIPNGEVWPVGEILKVKSQIEKAGLTWDVVESLPVSEEIKQATSLRKEHIENYKTSLRNLGLCGIKTVVYNFMPVLDWARTDLHFPHPDGGESMLFDFPTFVAFDVFILKRSGSEADYPNWLVAKAKSVFEKMPEGEAEKLAHNIIVVTQGFIDGLIDPSVEDYKNAFLGHLKKYENIGRERLKENLAFFLNSVIPVAEEVGVNLAIHPDDPPFPVLGLPRIFSTMEDLEWLEKTNPSLNNGIAFCAGSFSACSYNNLPEMVRRFGQRIHFLHLRNTKILEDGSFYESGHLQGGVDMYELMKAVFEEIGRRQKTGRSDLRIPVRPDHGIKILNDLGLKANPGYPLIGRLKGLAEITGLEEGILKSLV